MLVSAYCIHKLRDNIPGVYEMSTFIFLRQLMLIIINKNEKWNNQIHLLACNAMYFGRQINFWRNLLSICVVIQDAGPSKSVPI
jgi:hypothetical protein